jgi:hypothetical protein
MEVVTFNAPSLHLIPSFNPTYSRIPSLNHHQPPRLAAARPLKDWRT